MSRISKPSKPPFFGNISYSDVRILYQHRRKYRNSDTFGKIFKGLLKNINTEGADSISISILPTVSVGA